MSSRDRVDMPEARERAPDARAHGPIQGTIVTFYSYKGGTGRSMALANFAWILAAAGRRVVVIDWDLEAPGLHRYFRPFLSDPDLVETDGLIDACWSLASTAMKRLAPDAESTAYTEAVA